MDTTRNNLRLVFAPSVLIGSVLLADWIHGCLIIRLELISSPGVLAALVAIVAASVIPVGFAIGGLTRLVLGLFGSESLGCWRIGYGRYDLLVRDEQTDILLHDLAVYGKPTPHDRLYAVQDFVYKKLSGEKWLGLYIDRLWDASLSYFGAILALIGSSIIVFCMGIDSPGWGLVFAICGFMFLEMWRHARLEIERIITFHIKIHRPTQTLD